MSDLDYFILGIIVSIPIAIASPFATAAIQQKLAVRSERQGRLRKETLEREYAVIQGYHENQTELLVFVSTRILILLVFWIGQAALDVVFGFVVSGFSVTEMTINYAEGGYGYGVNFGPTSDWVGAIESLLDTIILALLFRTGIRVYRIVTKVMRFEQYEMKVKEELARIRDKNKLQGSELPLPDA